MDSEGVGVSFEPTISYSVKDILSRVEGKLDAALIAVATKAEQVELAKLADRVRDLERLEADRSKASTWKREFSRYIIPVLISAAATAAFVFQAVHGGGL